MIGLAYADLPRYHQGNITLDLFCKFLSNAYLQKHLLTIKPENLTEAVEAGGEYFRIEPGSTLGTNDRQVDKENTPDQVQATPAKPSEIEMLLQALRHWTSELEN